MIPIGEAARRVVEKIREKREAEKPAPKTEPEERKPVDA